MTEDLLKDVLKELERMALIDQRGMQEHLNESAMFEDFSVKVYLDVDEPDTEEEDGRIVSASFPFIGSVTIKERE